MGTYIHIDSQNTLEKPNYITRNTIERFSVLFPITKTCIMCAKWIHTVKDLREYLYIFFRNSLLWQYAYLHCEWYISQSCYELYETWLSGATCLTEWNVVHHEKSLVYWSIVNSDYHNHLIKMYLILAITWLKITYSIIVFCTLYLTIYLPTNVRLFRYISQFTYR